MNANHEVCSGHDASSFAVETDDSSRSAGTSGFLRKTGASVFGFREKNKNAFKTQTSAFLICRAYSAYSCRDNREIEKQIEREESVNTTVSSETPHARHDTNIQQDAQYLAEATASRKQSWTPRGPQDSTSPSISGAFKPNP